MESTTIEKNKLPTEKEEQRIQDEYKRRAREIPVDYYSLFKSVNLFLYMQKMRTFLPLLVKTGIFPFHEKSLCEVGCGTGSILLDFIKLGFNPRNISAIDLSEERITIAQSRLPKCDIRIGNADQLPWSDNQFDLIMQEVVFTSILDMEMKRKIAKEMLRVLKPTGSIIWYDFRVNNPKNKNVQGIGRKEIVMLFPNCHVFF